MKPLLTVVMAILLAAAVPAGALAQPAGSAPADAGAHASTAKKKQKKAKKKRCAKRGHGRRHKRCAKGAPPADPGTPVEYLDPDASKREVTRVLTGTRFTYCNGFIPCGQGIYEARLHFCDGGRFVYEARSGQQRASGAWSIGTADMRRDGSSYWASIHAETDDGAEFPLSILAKPASTKITYFERLSGGGVDVIEIIPEVIEHGVPCA